MQITPQWISSFETGLRELISATAQRSAQNLIWDKYMDVQTSQTLRELYFFLIEAATIRKEGQGGNKRYDDMAASYIEIINENSGDGLRLSKNEIEDNVMANIQGMTALRFAESWARQMGYSSTRWPQDQMFDLLGNGEAGIGYDGVAFFSGSHPVDPTKSGVPTFANLLTGAGSGAFPGACPIDASVNLDVATTNFAKAVAYIQSLKAPNGKPRNLRVTRALAGHGLKKRMHEILDTKYLTLNGIENVVSRYQIEPDIAAEIAADQFHYYLACEVIPGEGGPLIYQNREGYVLTSYALETLAELQRRKDYEWSYDGRNAAAYGRPELIFKVKAT